MAALTPVITTINLVSLQQIMRKCPNTRLFLIRRLHLRGEVQKHVSGIAEILPISPRKHEIGLYLRLRLNRARSSMQ